MMQKLVSGKLVSSYAGFEISDATNGFQCPTEVSQAERRLVSRCPGAPLQPDFHLRKMGLARSLVAGFS